MATVLPGSPPSFDKENETGTVRAVCNYLHTLHENVDFQLGQVRKSFETQQNMNTSLMEKNTALKREISALEQEIGALRQDITVLTALVSALGQGN